MSSRPYSKTCRNLHFQWQSWNVNSRLKELSKAPISTPTPFCVGFYLRWTGLRIQADHGHWGSTTHAFSESCGLGFQCFQLSFCMALPDTRLQTTANTTSGPGRSAPLKSTKRTGTAIKNIEKCMNTTCPRSLGQGLSASVILSPWLQCKWPWSNLCRLILSIETVSGATPGQVHSACWVLLQECSALYN